MSAADPLLFAVIFLGTWTFRTQSFLVLLLCLAWLGWMQSGDAGGMPLPSHVGLAATSLLAHEATDRWVSFTGRSTRDWHGILIGGALTAVAERICAMTTTGSAPLAVLAANMVGLVAVIWLLAQLFRLQRNQAARQSDPT